MLLDPWLNTAMSKAAKTTGATLLLLIALITGGGAKTEARLMDAPTTAITAII